ncbi:MAG TPA: retropepsin-like aspartic protease [Roseiarcus sp.]|jgi:hypothetical protein|nr:retropepsin-like aspartic protease [Roseiarcus sp.]
MACADQSTTPWTLAFDQDTGTAAFLKDVGRVRTGTYSSHDDLATITADEMHITLHVANGDASWKAGADRGVLSCRYVGDTRPARWQEASRDPSDPDDPFAPDAWADAPITPRVSPVAPHSAAPDGKLCDFEQHCYGSDSMPNAGGASPTGSVPIEVTDNQAFVTIRIGRKSFRALVDSGATSLSLPETGADGLIASGAAVEGPPTSVVHADGIARPCRTIIVNAVSIGGHVVHDVRSTVEPDTSIPLLGLGVLKQISNKISIDLAGAELRFE